ncbi:hypothetical protein Tco_0758095, partial [Tanacetum coccineum]
VLVDSKAPKSSSPTEEVPQGKQPGARSGLKRKQSSKHTSESTTKASKSKSGHSKKETKSSSAMDTSLSHPSPPTPVVGKMHKEAQQASGGPTSLGATSKEGATLSSVVDMMALAYSTTETDPEISAPKDFISLKHDMDEGTKTHSFVYIFAGSNPSVLVDKTESAGDGLKTSYTTSDILKDTRSAFFTPDSLIDNPIIVLDESEEKEEVEKDKDTEDTLVPPPPSPKSAKYFINSLKPELSKLLASHSFASYLPTELKELPSMITALFKEIKELKQHVRDMEIELSGDLIEIPTKLETFTSTISSLSSQVAERKNIQWKLPAEFLNLPCQLSSIQE